MDVSGAVEPQKKTVNANAFRGNPFGVLKKEQRGQVGTEGREVARSWA